MREIRNTNTGQVRLVPEGTADAVRTEKWLIKQGWVVVEHKATPNEVIHFQAAKVQEAQQVAQQAAGEAPCEKSCKQKGLDEKNLILEQHKQSLRALSVKKIAQNIANMSQEDIRILIEDPRKTVVELAERWLR